jgi:hypothetical protein
MLRPSFNFVIGMGATIITLIDSTKFKHYTVVLTLNPAAPENGIIFSLPQAVPAGQIKSFAIPP